MKVLFFIHQLVCPTLMLRPFSHASTSVGIMMRIDANMSQLLQAWLGMHLDNNTEVLCPGAHDALF